MNGQSFADFTLSLTSPTVMLKHFAGGLVTRATARPACLSLFPGTEFSFSAQRCSAVLLPCPEAGYRSGLTHFPAVPWVQEKSRCTEPRVDNGPLSLTAAGGNVLGKGITMGQGYTDPKIPELTSLSHYLSLAPQKLKQTARFSSWLTAVLGASSDSGLPT